MIFSLPQKPQNHYCPFEIRPDNFLLRLQTTPKRLFKSDRNLPDQVKNLPGMQYEPVKKCG